MMSRMKSKARVTSTQDVSILLKYLISSVDFSIDDVVALKRLKMAINACLESAMDEGNFAEALATLRTKLHEMEYYEGLTGRLVEQSKLLRSAGLPQVFKGYSDIFLWDIVSDARTLWTRWKAGQLDSSLFRGIVLTKGVLTSGKKKTWWALEAESHLKKSAYQSGANKLVNGQWYVVKI